MITSTSNNQVKNIVALNKKASERKARGLFVVEGARAAREVPKELIEAVYYSEGFDLDGALGFLDVPAMEVSAKAFKQMCDTVTPQGVLCVCKMPLFSMSDILGNGNEKSHVIILETLQDPGNLGTIIRTAEGAGATGIIMDRTTVDIYSPKVVRSTMGSIFRVPHMVVEDLDKAVRELKEKHGISVFASHLKGEKSYDAFDFTVPVAFLVGNEGKGLSDEMVSLATDYLKIPMEGALESLNASVAAAVLMYETHRQRGLRQEDYAYLV